MDDVKKREFALGIIILVAGIAYLFLTSQLPRKQFIDGSRSCSQLVERMLKA